jgi:hypothetical protein
VQFVPARGLSIATADASGLGTSTPRTRRRHRRDEGQNLAAPSDCLEPPAGTSAYWAHWDRVTASVGNTDNRCRSKAGAEPSLPPKESAIGTRPWKRRRLLSASITGSFLAETTW